MKLAQDRVVSGSGISDVEPSGLLLDSGRPIWNVLLYFSSCLSLNVLLLAVKKIEKARALTQRTGPVQPAPPVDMAQSSLLICRLASWRHHATTDFNKSVVRRGGITATNKRRTCSVTSIHAMLR